MVESAVSDAVFRISKAMWTVIHCDSAEPGEGPARKAIDDNPTSYWHTEWSARQPRHPHEIQIDLGEELKLTGFTYLPRQDMQNGRIARYSFYASRDGKRWGKPITEGTWGNSSAEVAVRFDRTHEARFIRLVALSEVTGAFYTSLAELGVLTAD